MIYKIAYFKVLFLSKIIALNVLKNIFFLF